MEYFDSSYPKYYGDVKLDSDIEYGFACWCEEMQQMGFINSFKTQPNEYLLLPDVIIKVDPKLKPKVKIEKRTEKTTLLNQAVYTPDFEIYWNPEKYVKFMDSLSWSIRKIFLPDNISSINRFILNECRQMKVISTVHDVKGSNDRRGAANGSSALRFSYQQKLLMETCNIYCSKLIPDKIYKATFVPTYWNKSPKTGKKFPRYAKYRSREQFRRSIFAF
jgi:hypothetical protein